MSFDFVLQPLFLGLVFLGVSVVFAVASTVLLLSFLIRALRRLSSARWDRLFERHAVSADIRLLCGCGWGFRVDAVRYAVIGRRLVVRYRATCVEDGPCRNDLLRAYVDGAGLAETFSPPTSAVLCQGASMMAEQRFRLDRDGELVLRSNWPL